MPKDQQYTWPKLHALLQTTHRINYTGEGGERRATNAQLGDPLTPRKHRHTTRAVKSDAAKV